MFLGGAFGLDSSVALPKDEVFRGKMMFPSLPLKKRGFILGAYKLLVFCFSIGILIHLHILNTVFLYVQHFDSSDCTKASTVS